MYIIGRTQMIEEEDLGTRIDRIAEAGFDGVELCLEARDFTPLDLGENDMRSAVRRIEKRGFAWNSTSFHQDYIHSDELFQKTLEAISHAALIDSRVLVISGGKLRSYEEDWPVLVERTRALAEEAESRGVKLALEFEPGFVVDSTESLVKLMDAVGSDAFGANLDLGHAFLQDSDPTASIRTLGERIFHCHVEDMGSGVHKHLIPGTGDMDLPALFAALGDIGFQGGLALDLYGVDYVAVAKDCLPMLKDLTS